MKRLRTLLVWGAARCGKRWLLSFLEHELTTQVGAGCHVVRVDLSHLHPAACGSFDAFGRHLDERTGALQLTLRGHTGSVRSAVFSPDGAQVLSASSDGTARIWDASYGKELLRLTGHSERVCAAAYSPTGRFIATASEDGTAVIWDARSGQQMTRLIGHSGWVRVALFSPDEAYVVTASEDRTARIWERASGRAMLSLTGHSAQVWSAAFSPDGRRIITASADGTARIHLVHIEDYLRSACDLLRAQPAFSSVREHCRRAAPRGAAPGDPRAARTPPPRR